MFVPGEPTRYDPDFSGPTHNRSCTDIVWLILFIVFLGAWGFVGYYGQYDRIILLKIYLITYTAYQPRVNRYIEILVY